MKAKFDQIKMDEIIDKANKIISFMVDIICENGKLYHSRLINRSIPQPMEDFYKDLTADKRKIMSMCMLKAYQIWGSIAYIRKQWFFSGHDRDIYSRTIWDSAYKTYDSEELNLYFRTIREYENDKFRQGARVIEIVLELNEIITNKIYSNDRFSLLQNLLPLSEFYLLCIITVMEKFSSRKIP